MFCDNLVRKILYFNIEGGFEKLQGDEISSHFNNPLFTCRAQSYSYPGRKACYHYRKPGKEFKECLIKCTLGRLTYALS